MHDTVGKARQFCSCRQMTPAGHSGGGCGWGEWRVEGGHQPGKALEDWLNNLFNNLPIMVLMSILIKG